MEMKNYKHKTGFILLFVVALQLVACQKQEKLHNKVEPAHIEHIEGSELSHLTLTEKAVERIGIQTTAVSEEMIAHSEARLRLVVPYSAILYDISGRTWVYTNPEPLNYVRHEVKVDFVEGGSKAILSEGPHVGAQVVTVGASELYGTEYQVGH